MSKPEKIKSQLDFPKGIHILSKPIGSMCNLKCDYCFYLEKQALYLNKEQYQMSDDVLKRYIESYILSQPTPEVEFVWQGGEPTLAGIDFYRKVIEYQKTYQPLKIIKNSLQTNGTLLTDDWCKFLKTYGFFVGLSLDGPQNIHDRYRHNSSGGNTFDIAMKGLRLLQKHGVEFNVLACVCRETAYQPLEVYHFFKTQGIDFIQFTPIIERLPDQKTRDCGLSLATPSALDQIEVNTTVTDWTVEPEKYGDFLIEIYEEWVRNDVGKVFIMNFEWALNSWLGEPSPVCIFSRQCGRSAVLEHNGDVYVCDHYVYPEYRLGNILCDDFCAMIETSFEAGFGPHKETMLPRLCRECEVLQACWGGCPKHRFAISYYDEPGLHYLCAGYKKFFLHIRKYLRVMATLIVNNLPAAHVMDAIKGPLVINLGNEQ